MALTPEDIESKKFLVGLRGYDKDEVTAFLVEVATDYRSALDGGRAGADSNGASAEAESEATDIVAQAEARAALEKYNAQLAEARTEANDIRESAREQGASIVDEMRGQAQAEAARITEAAKRQVEAERQQAVVQLRQEVGTLSTSLESKIVGESLEDEVRQKGIVDRFLAELEAGDVTPEKVTPAGQDA